MIYLIGLGLNIKGITLEGIEAIKLCKEIYLESYTIDFPYKINELENIIGKKIKILKRTEVESDSLIDISKNKDVALLIYGSPLFATTHQAIIDAAIEKKVKLKVIYSASVFDSVAITGLQSYKFGKICSIPKWQKNYKPTSFIKTIIENSTIGAHTLILTDISLAFIDAIDELKSAAKDEDYFLNEIVVCSNLATEKQKIFYGTIEQLKKQKVTNPYLFIVPGIMHFTENDSLLRFKIKK
jgi:diphthine methyl ester synthase